MYYVEDSTAAHKPPSSPHVHITQHIFREYGTMKVILFHKGLHISKALKSDAVTNTDKQNSKLIGDAVGPKQLAIPLLNRFFTPALLQQSQRRIILVRIGRFQDTVDIAFFK